MEFRSLRDVEVRGKRVVVREDLNVPLKGGAVADDTRIDAALVTLRYLRDNGARTRVLSHLGRPDGKINAAMSLRPVAARLAERLGSPVAFAEDCVGEPMRKATDALVDGDIVVCENVRFHPEEETNDDAFARMLAEDADLYVNDAFGTAHRAHASTAGIARHLPAVAGFLMEAELAALARLTENPVRPFICAIGGAKVTDKVTVLEKLLERVDGFVVGGGMANTFLAAKGIAIGSSLRDKSLDAAIAIIEKANARGVQLHLPSDAVVADAFDADDTATPTSLGESIGDRMILDIGPVTAHRYADVLHGAKTIVFNGPMGVYEKPTYQAGTLLVGRAIAEATQHGATSVVGGGDAAAAAHALNFASEMTHVSTGGGATLEFLEGKTLPGVAALVEAVRAGT